MSDNDFEFRQWRHRDVQPAFDLADKKKSSFFKYVDQALTEFWTNVQKCEVEVSIIVDSSPFFSAAGGPNTLPQTIVSQTNRPRGAEDSKLAFDKYFLTVLRTVRSSVYAFFHPSITGWHDEIVMGHRSKLPTDFNSEYERLGVTADSGGIPLSQYAIFKECYESASSLQYSSERSEIEPTLQPVASGTTELATVRGWLYDGQIQFLKLPIDEIKLYSSFIDKYYFREAAAGAGRVDVSQRRGFDYQQLACHHHLRQEMSLGLPLKRRHRKSVFLTTPLSFLQSDTRTTGNFPREFRGVCWVFALLDADDETTASNIETCVNRLSVGLRMALNHFYNAEAVKNLTEMGGELALRRAKDVASKLRDRIEYWDGVIDWLGSGAVEE
jgi:hypothetical protein